MPELIHEAAFQQTMDLVVEPALAAMRQTVDMPLSTGGTLHAEIYTPDAACRAVMILHGYTESGEKFREMTWYFLKAGYSVFVPDHRGHGRSVREVEDTSVTHVDCFGQYVQDTEQFLQEIVIPRTRGLPLCLYADCSEPELESRLQVAQELRAEGGYAFMMENQLISACAAAWNLSLDLVGNSEERFDIELVSSGETNRFALYSGDWQGAVGARVSLGEALAGRDIRTDADVWRRVGDELYVSLNRPVRVYEAAENEGGEGAGHLCLVNLPATVSASGSGATVSFREGGCMQVETSCPAVTSSAGWTATPLEGGGTLFTKYGAASSLSISYE